MRLAWAVVMLAPAVGVGALAACSSFSADDAPGAGDASSDAPLPFDGSSVDAARDGEGGPPCTDVQSDSLNCGACGHDCLGGACVKGACQAKRLVTVDNNIASLAVTDAGVHWVTSGGSIVHTCPPEGCIGDAGALAVGLVGTEEIVAVGEDVAVRCDGDVQWVTAAGAATRVGAAWASTRSIATDGVHTIYFTVSDPGNSGYIIHYDSTSDAGATSVTQDNAIRTVGVAGGHIFFYENFGAEALLICDAPACANARALVTTPASTAVETRFAPTKAALFWARVTGEINTCVAAGCMTPTQLYKAVQGTSIATDDTYVYFTTGTGETLDRCPQAGCAGANHVVLASGGSPHAVVVTGNAVYWATDGNAGANVVAGIWRLAK